MTKKLLFCLHQILSLFSAIKDISKPSAVIAALVIIVAAPRLLVPHHDAILAGVI